MIQLIPKMLIQVAVEPVDFRKGIDGLAAVCRKVLEEDPFSGYLFFFRNKKATTIKALVYDGQGFWLCQKRLSKGRFAWWPRGAPVRELAVDELHSRLWNRSPVKGQPPWRPVKK
ncbi:MAG: IS66 family insertion sequence element accessory protein TnpB [Desulfacinum sp.]|nr:IS66 family insertion sequence element accessory protein TnpB [Desulfacinum sp.]